MNTEQLLRCGFLLLALLAGSTVGMAGEGRTDSDSPRAAPTALLPNEATSLLDALDLQALWLENSPQMWLVLLAAIAVGLAAGRLIGMLLSRIGRRLEDRGGRVRAHVFQSLVGPLALALLAAGLMFGLAGLKMSVTAHHLCSKILLLLYTLSAAWYLFNLVEVLDLVLQRLTLRNESILDQQLVPLLRKSLRVLLVMVVGLFLLDSVFEKDIGAWLAGLGIAGIAISLAAQDSIKNLFGSLTILLDRPFKLGERIIYSGFDGTIEEIGFRSTKLRTLAGHLVTIPNLVIVNTAVENLSRRQAIRRVANLLIPKYTPAAKIDEALRIVRRLFDEPGLAEPMRPTPAGKLAPPQVVLSDFVLDGYVLSITYFYSPADFTAYSLHAERFNLRLLEEFEKAAIPVAGAPK